MRIRGSVAIDLGTVNTLVWVEGRGLVLEEPSAIAIDSTTGSVTAIGAAADVLSDKEPQDIKVHPPAARRRDRRPGGDGGDAARLPAQGPAAQRAAAAARAGLRAERRHLGGAAVRRRRARRAAAPVLGAAHRRAGRGRRRGGLRPVRRGRADSSSTSGGGTTEVAAVAGWRVVRAQSLRMAGNAMDDAIVNAARSRAWPDPQPAGGAAAEDDARPHRRAGRLGGDGRPRRRPPHAARGEGAGRTGGGGARAGRVATVARAVQEVLSDIPPASPRT